MYKKAGISDVKGFYKDKFAHEANFDVSDRRLSTYNINYSKLFWFFRNVKPGSKVLDFGCGSGSLAILKKKGCRITGIDYSEKALDIAMKVNNYESVFCGSIFEFNHPPESFDYIVSLDVFGHIPFEEKDSIIMELKKYLKPDGVMLHGIECGYINYDEMPEDALRSFIEVDGHVGIEDKMQNINRFRKFFRHVEGVVRFTLENSADEYLKQADEYGARHDSDLMQYMRSLTPGEREAFDIANGLVQLKLEERKVSLSYNKKPESSLFSEPFGLLKKSFMFLKSSSSLNDNADLEGGHLLLRASDRPLQEQDFSVLTEKRPAPISHLHDNRIFTRGWYDIEKAEERFFRWGAGDCLIQLKELKGDLQLRVFSPYPDIRERHVNVFFTNADTGEIVKKAELVNDMEHDIILKTGGLKKLDLGIFVDTTMKPSFFDPKSDDQRVLGIGISELKFL